MPIPDVPVDPRERWDQDAKDRAWNNAKRLIREGDQQGAALLLGRLKALGGEPWKMGDLSEDENEPYNPMAMYAGLAYHYHFTDEAMRWMDYRRLHGYARELTLMLERQSAAPPEPKVSEEEQEARQEAAAAGMTQRGIVAFPKPYQGPVVAIG